MRPQKILDKDLILGLTQTFRTKGYEGASVNKIAEITGLKKASLYHRFPGGKKEMAECVLNYMREWGEMNIISVLIDEKVNPEQRLIDGLLNIKSLYNEGKDNCVFRALSMQSGLELFEKQIKKGMQLWIHAFTKIGEDFGLPNTKAKAIATNVLIEIQGSLIVSKGLNDNSVFDTTLNNIKKHYLN